jgi:hypothetical protein
VESKRDGVEYFYLSVGLGTEKEPGSDCGVFILFGLSFLLPPLNYRCFYSRTALVLYGSSLGFVILNELIIVSSCYCYYGCTRELLVHTEQ